MPEQPRQLGDIRRPDGGGVSKTGGLIQCLTGVALCFSFHTSFGGKLILAGKLSNFSFHQIAKDRIELRSRMRVIVGNVLDIWSH